MFAIIIGIWTIFDIVTLMMMTTTMTMMTIAKK